MEEKLYEMIYKRKSFHLFRETGKISPEELESVQAMFFRLTPLYPDIKVDMKIVPGEQTTCKRGQEYCILLFSEKRDGYLPNMGYLGGQLDLHLASMNIGALWFGIGKTDIPAEEGLDFVIMIAIAKMEEDRFRKDMFKSKRKPSPEIWRGEIINNVSDIIRFAPSACNTQPWMVEHTGNRLLVYRYKKQGKRGIMPADRVTYYNRIDIGIFLLFLELCLHREGMKFERTLYNDNGNKEITLIASYDLKE